MLFDLKIVHAEDLKVKRSNWNFWQNLANLPTQILDAGQEWSKLQKILKGLFPKMGKSWWYLNIRRQDWTILQTEVLRATAKEASMAVPKYRILPENYRY